MRGRVAAALLAVAAGSTGCSAFFEARGIEPAGADNPRVTVTARRETVPYIPGGSLLFSVGYRPKPPLSVSFARALGKYVDHGTFRIESSAVNATGGIPLVIYLDMVVSSDGQTYRLRATREYPFINRSMRDFPLFLDDCARQLAAALNKSRDP